MELVTVGQCPRSLKSLHSNGKPFCRRRRFRWALSAAAAGSSSLAHGLPCVFSTWTASTVTDANMPDITVTYGSGAHSGSCKGTATPCPQVAPCGGKVNMHVVPKPFTSFTDHPGAYGVNAYGTFDFTETLSDCGESFYKDFDVWAQPAGDNLGRVTMWAFCTWCSDSNGEG